MVEIEIGALRRQCKDKEFVPECEPPEHASEGWKGKREEVFPVICSSFPCYAEIVPCYFSQRVSLKTRVDAGFVANCASATGLNFRFSLYFSLLFGNWRLETGSNLTASSASQCGLHYAISGCVRTADIPAG
jgi:hypothetical protein